MSDLLARARAIAGAVPDPELPALTIADLGVLREVRPAADGVEVLITPTYVGCPAMDMIAVEVATALDAAGIAATVRTVMAPAWTTDWLSDEAREKLRAAGIAPPPPGAGRRALFGAPAEPACPHCGSARTEEISAFGATACKALWRCLACREPFDAFKCH